MSANTSWVSHTESSLDIIRDVLDKSGILHDNVILVVFGASGDLAKKKIYPTLWHIFRQNLFPKNTCIYGYARSEMTREEFISRLVPFVPVKSGQEETFKRFCSALEYSSGGYDKGDYFVALNEKLNRIGDRFTGVVHRMFYLALPPSIFISVTENIQKYLMAQTGWSRVIVEKPFGKDSESSAVLSEHLSRLFSEEQIYRIDHYLGKEMVQTLLVLRFGNNFFQPVWNRNYIDNIQITFKEPFGVKGRGGYFDEFGIIRDVMQNHLIQVLCLVAMEKPCRLLADEIRNEKVKVLKSILPLTLEDIVLGQYVANKALDNPEAKEGYLDDAGVPKDSICPTYACAVLHIHNERWDGVPFILKCGKALNERKAEVRIQFKDVPGNIFSPLARNELVIRVQPDESVYLKMMLKKPGLTTLPIQTELDLSYNSRYKDLEMPDAYERLLLDVLRGSQMQFVRTDELAEAWRIFTPLLHSLEHDRVRPIPYEFGGRGPAEADDFIRRKGFVYYSNYVWESAE